ncbi:MAG TPA: hypothetical protein VE959_22460 [Bryobacteraceae bacterium]|nr:hypothetical protein [Bryobacteraceae bacterium]
MKQFLTSFLVDELFVLWTFFFAVGVILVWREVTRRKHLRQHERRMRLLVRALRLMDTQAAICGAASGSGGEPEIEGRTF